MSVDCWWKRWRLLAEVRNRERIWRAKIVTEIPPFYGAPSWAIQVREERGNEA